MSLPSRCLIVFLNPKIAFVKGRLLIQGKLLSQFLNARFSDEDKHAQSKLVEKQYRSGLLAFFHHPY